MDDRQRRTLIVALALLLISAIVVLFFWTRAPRAIPREYTTSGICLACKRSTLAKHPAKATFPIRCPSCGDDAFYPWYFCYQCNYRFVPALAKIPGEPPRLPITIQCPKCRTTNVGALFALDERQANPAGDLPLPKWPP
ncbi:MAG: hypothetical protein U1D55_06830 [Phycisphaerae bacterium]